MLSDHARNRAPDVERWLRAGDPARDERPLEPAEIAAMRRALETPARVRAGARALVWVPAILVSAAAIIALLVRSVPSETATGPALAHRDTVIRETRMLIETPGGTRVLWIVPARDGRSRS